MQAAARGLWQKDAKGLLVTFLLEETSFRRAPAQSIVLPAVHSRKCPLIATGSPAQPQAKEALQKWHFLDGWTHDRSQDELGFDAARSAGLYR